MATVFQGRPRRAARGQVEFDESTRAYLVQADRDLYQAQIAERGFIFVKEGTDGLCALPSTEEIQKKIKPLRDATGNAVEVMQTGRHNVQASVTQAAGEALQAITNAVASTSDMNTQIATAAAEQSAVTDDINRNLSQLSELSTGTASRVGQTNAASSDLARLAAARQAAVARFTLDIRTNQPPTATPPHHRRLDPSAHWGRLKVFGSAACAPDRRSPRR